MKTLFAWIGTQDLIASGARKGDRKIDDGPILAALKSEEFDAVALISNYDTDETGFFENWLVAQTKCKLTTYRASYVVDPTNLDMVYRAALEAVNTELSSSKETELIFHMSPGTWAMAVCWLIISETRHPARLVQSSIESGLSETTVPFELHAEYIAKVNRSIDEKLLLENRKRKPLEFGKLLFRSDVMQRLATKAAKSCNHDFPLLIQGDIGTEREELARSIHLEGHRRKGAFIKVQCGLHCEEELNEILVGKNGAFEQSKGGVLYLEDIEFLPLNIQTELTKVLQNAESEKLNNHETKVNSTCRVIASCRGELIENVKNAQFNEALYFILTVLVLKLPNLSERKSDISLLIDQIVDELNEGSPAGLNISKKSLTPRARKILIEREWKANTRELRNVLQRAFLWGSEDAINHDDIWDAVAERPPASGALHDILDVDLESGIDLKTKLEEYADYMIDRALDYSNGNKSNAAKLLGFPTYQAFAYWVKRREKKKAN